ncbi:salicylate synthase [Niveispirillum sp. SYP-B3756]|uniref:salicylate synthase n=1 Tax=Niveispirillum sp. SYP-B3756 TaxID=2662178 RepID=UPI0012910B2A|nr:salicylate synthase [Niveispirillum sp. SYP-B3756]MQP65073.1 salicylate synthase [Niveispirillum sp. SYP-B3756]
MEQSFYSWPADIAQTYQAKGYWQPEPLGDLFRNWAATHPTRTALVDGPKRLTYASLATAIDQRAAGLADLGILAGDRVLLQLPNSAAFVVTLFALFRLGALPVMVMPAQRLADLAPLCELAQPVAHIIPDRFLGFDYRPLARDLAERCASLRHILVDGEVVAGDGLALAALDADPRPLPAPDAFEPALLLLSGGTTGTPKLIPRTHADYAYNGIASARLCGLGPESVYLAALPVAHNFPLCCPGIIGTFSVGGTVAMARTPGFDEAFPLIERERVTITALVPALLPLWIGARDWDKTDLSSLRLLQVGGARLEPELAARVRPALGCQLQQVFGMAEGLLCYTRPDDPEEVVQNSQGRPLCTDDDVRLVDADGRDVPDGQTGELLVRGPYTIRGYYRAAAHNARVFTPDGYYRSGDLARRMADGNLVVEGRVKDQINRGGEKIATAEIEQHLRQHPGIRDATLVAVADARLGERSCAFIIPGADAPDLAALHRFLGQQGLARHKLPDQLEQVKSWPLTAIGKIDKKQLVDRAQAAAGKTQPSGNRSYSETQLTISSDPMELATRIAAHEKADFLMVYEREGEWSVAIGQAASISADATGITLSGLGGPRHWPTTDICTTLPQTLASLPLQGWRLYGSADFELARQIHGLDLAADTGRLVHLVAPLVEIRLRQGQALLRCLDGEALALRAQRLKALDGPSFAEAASDTASKPHGNRRLCVPAVETADIIGYKGRVAAAVQEIRDRHYQKVILSRRVPVDAAIDPTASYRLGRQANNPARSFILFRDGLRAIGYSPETVAEVSSDGWVNTQPLAGTRALGGDAVEEAALRAELVSDTKEIAEHAVSVKLACEELTAICEPGTVQVVDFMSVCRRGSVQHLGSRVKGRLAAGRQGWDALRTLFPAVTASGIPKREAIEAIGRHEPGPRGLYSGCVLVADADGMLDAALVLRALYEQQGRVWLQAGAGLVSLSTPEREFRETCEKLHSVSPFLVAAADEGERAERTRA